MNPENTLASCKTLALKMARIQGAVGKVGKTGKNEYHGYNYVTENDLVYAVRDLLAAEKVAVFSSTDTQKLEMIEEEGGKSCITTVTTYHTFVCGETGESFTVKSQGQGWDKGDKGGYKAMTGAMKYFLYKCFLIPTGDDPEGDKRTDERAAQQRQAPQGQQEHGADWKPGDDREAQQRGQAKNQADKAKSTAGNSQQVPRDEQPPITDDMRHQFTGNLWQRVKIHVGKKQVGKTLGEITQESLNWWIQEWHPKKYQGKWQEDDLLFRAALDVANEEAP